MAEILGPKQSIAALLDEALLAKAEKDKESKGAFPLRPSAAGYCGRKLAHDYAAFIGLKAKVHEDRKPSVIRLLELGQSIEYHALQQLKLLPGYKLGFKQQVVSLFKLPSGRFVEGSIDVALLHDDPAMRGILDVKSVGDRFSKAYASSWDEDIERFKKMQSVQQIDEYGFYVEDVNSFIKELGEHALVSNITQVNLYVLSDFFKERGFTWGSIYRYQKNASKHYEVRFKPSVLLFNKVKAKYTLIDKTIKTEKDIEKIKRDFALGSMACAYCPYRADCYPEATKKQIFSGFPSKQWAQKIGELEGAPELREMFIEYGKASIEADKAALLEKQIMVEMQAHQVNKIKLDDGRVFEIKYLKDRAELRPSKE
jgi:hypothetical protein